MNRILATLLALAFTTSIAPAMISFGYLSPDEAAKHDLEVRYRAAGPKDVSVQVSFATTGRWKDFAESKRHHYIELSLDRPGSDGKGTEQILRTTLREGRSTKGRLSVYFVIERAKLHQASIWLTRRIVDVADVVRMKDFIALDSIGRAEKIVPASPKTEKEADNTTGSAPAAPTSPASESESD